jgi:hypothetical protein
MLEENDVNICTKPFNAYEDDIDVDEHDIGRVEGDKEEESELEEVGENTLK